MGLRSILLITFGGKAFSVLGFLLVSNLLVRHLSPVQMGLFILSMSWVGFLSLIAQAGLNQSIYRLISSSKEKNSSISLAALAYRFVFHLSVAIGIVHIALGLTAKHIGLEDKLQFSQFQFLAMSIWLIASAMQSIGGEIFRSNHDNLRAVIYGAPGGVLGGTLNIAIVIIVLVIALIIDHALGLTEIIFLMAFGQMLSVAASQSPLRKHTFRSVEDKRIRRASIPISYPLLLSAIVTYFLAQSDVWLVNLVQSAMVANYGIANALAKYVSAANILIYAAIPALVAQLTADKRPEELNKLLRKTANLSAMCALLVISCMGLFGREFILISYGPEYESAYALLLILAVGHLINSFVGNPLLIAVNNGADRVILKMNLVAIATAIVGGIVVGRTYGAVGVAATFAFAYAVNGIYLALYVKKRWGVRTSVSLSI